MTSKNILLRELIDPRHPERWKKVDQCRTVGNSKQNILHVSNIRNDTLADVVWIKVNGAAQAASQERCLKGLMNSEIGLIQTVADNFDVNISSPNGLNLTHSLALRFTQIKEHTLR